MIWLIQFGYLCYKLIDKEEVDSSSSDIDSESGLENNKNGKKPKKKLTKLGKYSLYMIPYQLNEYKFIKKIHEYSNHRNWDDTLKDYKKEKYLCRIYKWY